MDLDAERAVLGSVLLDNSALAVAAGILEPADFYLEAGRKIFAAMLAMQGESQAIDAITLKARLADAGELEAVGGPVALVQLTDGLPRTLNVAHYARSVKEKCTLRSCIQLGNQLQVESAQPEARSAEVLDKLQDEVIRLYPKPGGGYEPMKKVAAEGYAELEERSQKGTVSGAIPTGLKALDAVIGGLRRQQLIVVAARPGNGKSALVHGIATNAALRLDKRVGISSLEMSRQEIYDRMVSAEARVDMFRLAQGWITHPEWKAISEATSRLANSALYIDDTGSLTIGQLRAKAQRLWIERGLDLLIVDYLQLMVGTRRTENRAAEVSEISRGLKLIAKDLNIPVLAVSQLNRSSEIKGDRPKLSELRESGSIEQDADVVMLLWRENHESQIVEVNIAKQRSGPTAKKELAFIARYTSFECLTHVAEDADGENTDVA
jgi:replicative DNA helicase